MSYKLALDTGKNLSELGDKQLPVGEDRYGLGDDYVAAHKPRFLLAKIQATKAAE